MNSLENEIAWLSSYFAFIRWLSVRIELSDLPTVTKGKLDETTELTEYTQEATSAIIQFVEYAINVFNVSHFHDRLTPVRIHDVIAAINEIWQQDALALQKMRLIEK